MSTENTIYTHPLLSDSSLDHGSDTTIADEKAALGDAYQRNAARSHKLRAGLLIGSILLNAVLVISLAFLYARFRNRTECEWKGAPQLWSTSGLRIHSFP